MFTPVKAIVTNKVVLTGMNSCEWIFKLSGHSWYVLRLSACSEAHASPFFMLLK